MSAAVDAIVAGGGPAGAAAALVLARAGRRVVLAERADRARFKVGEALPGAARPILRELGLWEPFAGDGHLPSYGNRAAWGLSEPLETDFIHDPNGHGWHVDRGRFEAFLRSAAREAGAELLHGVGVRASGSQLAFEGARRGPARARMLVDATGRPAALARRRGGLRYRGDRLLAVYAAVRAVPEDLDTRTLIEAAPDGWWYTARVPNARRIVAFLTDADLVPRDLRSDAGFRAALARTAHVGPRIGSGAELLELGTAPAHSSYLDPPCGDGWLAVGDAALAFDPLSSQGMLTALFTGLAAGRAIDAQLDGDRGALEAYRARLATIRTAYERNRFDAYQLEPRWSTRPFWARRSTLKHYS